MTMSSDPGTTLNVGVIGVGSVQSWAREAHVAAVHAVPGLELLAVSTRDSDTAPATADDLGARRGYGDALQLIHDNDIDIVTVGAPVPAHRELVLAALNAGKHVVTEWPVGTSTAQTEEIAGAAARSGRHAAVDLQARENPAAMRARELLASNAIGRVLNVTVYSSTMGFGAAVTKQSLYLEDPASGMNLTTIQTAHTVDLVIHLAGSLTSLAALRTVRYRDLTVTGADGDTPQTCHRTVPDHVLLQGRFADGGALTMQVAGGRPPGDAPFRLDIQGEHGTLTLDCGGDRGFQAGAMRLHRDGKPVIVPDAIGGDLPDSVINVAHVYAGLRNDIASGATDTPGFEDAVRLSHLIDDLIKSDAEQRTVTPSAQWP
jgi:predicted dehydrogenase